MILALLTATAVFVLFVEVSARIELRSKPRRSSAHYKLGVLVTATVVSFVVFVLVGMLQ
jgi:hypothetical protein